MKIDTCLDDHSRVVLKQQEAITGSDYINASHIDVSLIVAKHLDIIYIHHRYEYHNIAH